MRRGNTMVYEKARAALPADAPEQPLLDQLIRDSQEALDFEHAIDRVMDGDTARGLTELRRVKSRVSGPVWAASFLLWRVLPGLARPMLAWRRKAHSRGNQSGGVLGSILPEGIAL